MGWQSRGTTQRGGKENSFCFLVLREKKHGKAVFQVGNLVLMWIDVFYTFLAIFHVINNSSRCGFLASGFESYINFPHKPCV